MLGRLIFLFFLFFPFFFLFLCSLHQSLCMCTEAGPCWANCSLHAAQDEQMHGATCAALGLQQC